MEAEDFKKAAVVAESSAPVVFDGAYRRRNHAIWGHGAQVADAPFLEGAALHHSNVGLSCEPREQAARPDRDALRSVGVRQIQALVGQLFRYRSRVARSSRFSP